ncbi:glycosyltransferase [Methanobacterium formicicum]|uniref:Glycosyltransferase n=1 Tax=Methanobacterium formicicum TaxID=2162 RepID=A0A843AN65_METFO|nr:glycosyltransferase [Methanobacterium formicicum]MBF4475246.1 glycosyltransferase [Methanobacterium formicicum]
MKVLQVSNFFKPSFESGGVARSVYNISKALAEKGHNITVFTTNYSMRDVGVETNKPLNVEGMCVYYFNNLRKFFPFKIPPLPYYAPLIVRKEIKNFDMVHIHEHRTLLASIVYFYAKKNGIPYIIQSRGSVLPFYQTRLLKKFYDYCWGNKILKNAKTVIALTKEEVKQYESMGIDKDKIRIIPNSIDCDRKEKLIKGKFRLDHGFSCNEQIILYLGRLDKIKGLDILVEAFADITKDFDNVKLVIVGHESKFMEFLKSLAEKHFIEDKVVFTGPLYGNDKFEAYLDADVYVLPSRYETFPNTVLESCACGTPVVVTDRCGISDLIKDNVGLVVKCEKTSLKVALVELLENDELRDRLSNNCTEFVNNNFNLEKIISKFVEIYKNA